MKELDTPYVEMARDFRPWLSFSDLCRRTRLDIWTLSRHLKNLEGRHKVIELKVDKSKDTRPRARGKRLKVNRKIYTFYHVYEFPETGAGVQLGKEFHNSLTGRRILGEIIGTKANDSSRCQISKIRKIGKRTDWPSGYAHEYLDRLSLDCESQLDISSQLMCKPN